MTFRLSRAAEQDLIDIHATSLQMFGEAQAGRYQDVLERAFDAIAAFPEIARERPEFDPPVRIHPCKAHVIVYVSESDGPLIIRVRHGREDWASADNPA